MSTVISVHHISKQYRLGQVGTGTISHDLNRWWHRVRGKEDPYLRVGETNDRAQKGSSDYVWALRDVSFDVNQGEVLGIIGRNGAGKSTLLKILSRTTAPTTGQIKVRGRIASLLEVGTGFHPELSGRENIFLNGAILGMTKHEITRKFDEIVDFAGVERYIDTPVKRYSSGMYVRLAFGVAAHLEPEILIVDEVLAVGDAEFQNKCIGKMRDVSEKEGRTVLFVSHNMGAVKSLCRRGILMAQGSIKLESDNLDDLVNKYLNRNFGGNNHSFLADDVMSTNNLVIRQGRLRKTDGVYDIRDTISMELEVECIKDIGNHAIFIELIKDGIMLGGDWDVSAYPGYLQERKQGKFNIEINLPAPMLKEGRYNIGFRVTRFGTGDIQVIPDALSFEVRVLSENPRFSYAVEEKEGYINLKPAWHYREC